MRDDLIFGVQIDPAPDRLEVSLILFISRSGITLLGLDAQQRPSGFREILFPATQSNALWASRVEHALRSMPQPTMPVSVAVVDGVSEIFLPETLADPELVAPAMNLACSNSAHSDVIVWSKVSSLQAEAYCQLPAEIKAIADNWVKPLKWIGAQAVLGLSLVAMARTKPEVMVIDLGPETIRIGLAQGGQLSFINCFEVNADNDALYFALSACKACGIDPHKTEVLVGFHHIEVEPVKRLLKTYFNQVSAVESYNSGQWPYTYAKLAKGQYHLLFEAVRCV